jgi:hypothetical protein
MPKLTRNRNSCRLPFLRANRRKVPLQPKRLLWLQLGPMKNRQPATIQGKYK